MQEIFIIFSTPAPSSFSLHAESARPLLRSRYNDGLEQALLLQALELVTDHSQDDKQWKALTYQVLLSQGKQQAISLSRGVLDLVRFEHLKHRLGGTPSPVLEGVVDIITGREPL